MESHIKNHEDFTKCYSTDIQNNNLVQSLKYQIQELNKQLNLKENVNISLILGKFKFK